VNARYEESCTVRAAFERTTSTLCKDIYWGRMLLLEYVEFIDVLTFGDEEFVYWDGDEVFDFGEEDQ